MTMTSTLCRIVSVGAWLAFVVTPQGGQAALTPEKLYQKVVPSVMTLEVENQSGEKFIGSAVLALADDVALTAWHVVADARSVWAVFANGQRVKVVGCLDHDGWRDLALLKLEKPLPHRRASLCRELQPVAARVYVIGAPKGYEFSISDGLISQLRSVDGLLQYQVSCPISPGNSGGPILNHRGEVIGIASWTKADAQNVSFAIPTGELVRLNVTKQLTTWEQQAPIARQAPPAKSNKASHGTDMALDTNRDAGGFAALQKRLSDCAGQPVTVVVQEAGRTNVYSFTGK
jgi:S1-C subfamily serine protease